SRSARAFANRSGRWRRCSRRAVAGFVRGRSWNRRRDWLQALSLPLQFTVRNSIAFVPRVGECASQYRGSPRSWLAAPPSLPFPPRGPPAQTFRGDVEQRNDEDPEERRSEHAAEHRRAHRLAGDGAGAFGDDQRDETEDEREAGHHHRAKPQARGFYGAG